MNFADKFSDFMIPLFYGALCLAPISAFILISVKHGGDKK